MPNNIISNTVTLTGSDQKLCDGPMVFSFRLTAHIGNIGDVTVITPGGTFELSPGASSEKYISADLYELMVNGSAGDKIVYDGGTE